MMPNVVKECKRCDKNTLHELKDGCLKCYYGFYPTFSNINTKKALKEKTEAIRREYESFEAMYRADGLLAKSVRKL